MKFNKKYQLRKIANENVLVLAGGGEINMGRIITLNESAFLVYERLADADFDKEDIAGILTEHYDVDSETALQDASCLIEKFVEVGVIEK